MLVVYLQHLNLIFGAGTYDNYAFAFDGETGEEIWKYKMKGRNYSSINI